MTGIIRISQLHYCPDGAEPKRTQLWNNGTHTAQRITFNGEWGIPMHEVLESTPCPSSIQFDVPAQTNIKLLVSLPKGYESKHALIADILVETKITVGELAQHSASLFKKLYDEIQTEFGEQHPSLEEDSKSERPVCFDRLLLMSLDRLTEEGDSQTQWWQIVYALDGN